jgi:two-component system NarL family sensor kinase
VYILLSGVGLYLQVRTNATIGAFPIILFTILLIVVGVWPVIGALIVTHHPRQPVGWLLFAAFPLAAIDMFSLGYASYAGFLASGSLLVPGVMLIWLNLSGLPFVVLSFTLMNLLFPNGELLSRGWRVIGLTCAGALLIYIPLQILEPGPLALFPALDNPYAVTEAVWAVLMPLYYVLIATLLLSSLASVISLFLRLRKSWGDEQQQVKWLLFPAVLFWISIPFGFMTEYDPSGIDLTVSIILALVSVPVMVIAVAIAIFKYNLYDIDIVVNRTLVYGALTVIVVGVYALIVGGLALLFQSKGKLITAFIATGIVIVLFDPLRQRLQRTVNRLLYGERDEPLSVLRRLGGRLEHSSAPENILLAIVETVAQALKLPYAEITLQRGEEFERAAWYGEETKGRVAFQIQYQGHVIGYLSVAPRRQGESLTESDGKLLRQIAQQAGPVAQAVQLTRDLRQSRARLVTAREEERRRLRRDLHDGLGPVLASQGLKIAAVSHLLDKDPGKARKLLDELASQNEATVAEIRRLVYELRPPELDKLGLAGAVHDYASGLDVQTANGAGFEVNVGPLNGELLELPSAVEVAAYRIATEALTNVVRHAQARHCTVHFKLDANSREKILLMEIMDDGIGLPNDGKAGVGMNSMRERAEEVGGELRVESTHYDGTRVIARLPLAD